jgi:hypothetical protein
MGTIIFRGLLSSPSQAAEALTELRNVTLGLLGRLYGTLSSTAHPLTQPTTLRHYAERWQLPPLPETLESRELTIDLTLLRAEMLWIHLTCLQDPKLPIPGTTYEQVKEYDSQIAATYVAPDNRTNPFQGMTQSLIVAGNSHKKLAERTQATVQGALASGETKKAWLLLRDEVRETAREVGFPQADALFRHLSTAA